MKAARLTGIVGILVVAVLAGRPGAGAMDQARSGAPPQAPPKTAPPAPGKATPPAPAPAKGLAAAAWPDAKTIADRQQASERRRLFASAEPLAITLVADFKAVNRDRDPASTKTFPATIQFAKDDGSTTTMPLRIRTRGHVRRRTSTCSFAPLRLEFPKDQTSKTVFDGHGALKLGTHCREVGEFEEYVLREYAAYRIFNMLTPRSFRARLAKATYVDAATKKTIASRWALFVEDDDDVARRMGGRITDRTGTSFPVVDSETLALMTLFEFMIGNTDMSMAVQHNIRLVETPAHKLYPVPYDFDYSGLVNAAYAVPDKTLGITSVRERLYRGPCLAPEKLDPFFAKIRAVRAEITALYDQLPDLKPGSRKDAKNYLDDFFELIDRPKDVKKAFVDGCGNRVIM